MLLNIYLISHPIIQLLSESLKYQNTDKDKYISLFLFYEFMRKYLKVKIIYIKKIYDIHKLYILDTDQEYYIITNLVNTYSTITEIKQIIPSITILNINSNITLLNEELRVLRIYPKKIKKIIILETILNQTSIVELINILTNEYEIYIYNIYIVSVTCYNQILENLGKKYPKLNIYTTEII